MKPVIQPELNISIQIPGIGVSIELLPLEWGVDGSPDGSVSSNSLLSPGNTPCSRCGAILPV